MYITSAVPLSDLETCCLVFQFLFAKHSKFEDARIDIRSKGKEIYLDM